MNTGDTAVKGFEGAAEELREIGNECSHKFPLHPSWTVVMVRKGEPLLPGDFSAPYEDEVCYKYVPGHRPDVVDSRAFRYWGVSAEDHLAFLKAAIGRREADRQAKAEAACAKLQDIAAVYRSAKARGDEAMAQDHYKALTLFLNENDFGCRVMFDAETGYVRFGGSAEDEEDLRI